MDEIIQLIWEHKEDGTGLLIVHSNIRDTASIENYEHHWKEDDWDRVWPEIPVEKIGEFLDDVIRRFNEQGFFITASYTESKISHFVTMQKFNSRSHD